MFNIFKSSVVLAISIAITACGGGGSSDKPATPVAPTQPTNTAPTITVENVTVNENTPVTITATASDVDGDLLTYTWNQVSGKEISFSTDENIITFETPEVDNNTTLLFDVSVSDGSLSSKATSTVSIVNTPEPTITMNDMTVIESNGIQQVTVLLTLSNAYAKDIHFNYRTVDDTAKQNNDYQAINGRGNIVAGETEYNIDINIVGDTTFARDDKDEVFRLLIEDVEFALINKNYSEITIKNDDVPFVSTALFEVTSAEDEVDSVFTPYVFEAGLPNKVWFIQITPHTVNGDRISQEMIDSGESFSPFHLYSLNENGEVYEVTADLFIGNNETELHNVREAVVADFNNDGLEDIAFAVNTEDGRPIVNLWKSENKILLSQPNGQYKLTAIVAGLEDYSHSIAAGDINNDGHADLVIGSGGNDYDLIDFSGTYVALNDGKGTFSISQHFSELDGDNWGSVHTADLDNDGQIEIITGGWTSPYIKIFKKDEQGIFQQVLKRQAIADWQEEIHPNEPWRKSYSYTSLLGEFLLGGIADIKTSDINGDGLLDIVIHLAVGDLGQFNPARDVQLWMNQDGLSFSHQLLNNELVRYQSGQFIQLLDIDYDGLIDINFCSEMPNKWSLASESVYFGNAQRNFDLYNPFNLSDAEEDATCSWFVDLTNDGILDVLQSDMHQSRGTDTKTVNVLVGQ